MNGGSLKACFKFVRNLIKFLNFRRGQNVKTYDNVFMKAVLILTNENDILCI